MTAYVARRPDGSIAMGWILKSGTSINSALCRAPLQSLVRIEEAPVDFVLSGADGKVVKDTHTPARKIYPEPVKYRET